MPTRRQIPEALVIAIIRVRGAYEYQGQKVLGGVTGLCARAHSGTAGQGSAW